MQAWTGQPLQELKLQEREENKNEKRVRKMIRKNPRIKCAS